MKLHGRIASVSRGGIRGANSDISGPYNVSGSAGTDGCWGAVSVSERCLGYRREMSTSSDLSGIGLWDSFFNPHFKEGM